MIEKEFEVMTFIKKLRESQLVTQVMLSKYQRLLLPYFKHNLIQQNLKKDKDKEIDKIKSMKIPDTPKGQES
jgi:hypothetical protein